MVDALARWFIQSGWFDVNAIIKSEIISRRKALSLMGLAAAFGLAAAPSVLTVSDAAAQTIGMQRRQERRAGRHERRDERRTGRTERREERRTGTTATAPAGTTTGSAK
jgi:methionine salvage enolase-phosphatase E1